MLPTLVSGDRLLLLSTPLYHTPSYGDIIVASKDSFEDGEPIIKRVIAVEGQTVDIDFSTGTVYVDGVALNEPYINNLTTLSEGVNFPLVVEDGCVFVLGDNRGDSLDSRSSRIGNNGLIDTRYVLGHAIYRIFPFNRIGRLDNK